MLLHVSIHTVSSLHTVSSIHTVSSQGTWTLLGELVYQHLLQEGYMNSAAAVNRDLLDNAHEVRRQK